MNVPLKGWLEDFNRFALKGNVIDLAVAVIIGAAFGAVVNSLVKDVIMPLLSYVIPTGGGYHAWHIGRIMIGNFLAEVVNFLIIALAVYLAIVKTLGLLMKKAEAPAPPAEPTIKECPKCLSMIPIKATKCAHCTADLP